MSSEHPTRREQFTIACVTLDPSPVCAVLDERYEDLSLGAVKRPYKYGRIGPNYIVVQTLPDAGIITASASARALKDEFPHINIAVAVGIAGGTPGIDNNAASHSNSEGDDIRLGDIVVSRPGKESGGVIHHDQGSYIKEGFIRTGSLDKPCHVLLQTSRQLEDDGDSKIAKYLERIYQQLKGEFTHQREENDLLFEVDYDHVGPGKDGCAQCDRTRLISRSPRVDTKPKIHYGTIASGSSVIKDTVKRRAIRANPEIKCVETEAAGLMDALHPLVIRGISDYADTHKNDKWRSYAAATAAAYMMHLLSNLPPQPIEESLNAAPKVHFSVPFERNDAFVGREQQLEYLSQNLLVVGKFSKISIFGLGGVGKTQIVNEFAYRTRDKYHDCSVFWVSSSTLARVEQAFLDIGELLGMSTTSAGGFDAKAFVRKELSSASGKWLLIVDNADDSDIWFRKDEEGLHKVPMIDWLPKSNKGSILFTTRTRQAALKMTPTKDPMQVEELNERDATVLLQKNLYSLPSSDNSNTAQILLQRLTYLPLAITQAAAYINSNQVTVSKYLSLMEETEEQMIALLSEDFEDEGRYRDAKNPIATTWLISFEQIRLKHPLAVDYLAHMSCLDPNNVPDLLLPAATERKALEAIGILSAYSFVTIRTIKTYEHPEPEARVLSLHRLVRLATRNWLRNANELEHWTTLVMARIDEVFSEAMYEHTFAHWLTHAQYVLKSRYSKAAHRQRMRLLLQVSHAIEATRAGIPADAEAEAAIKEVLDISKRENGEKHPYTLASMCHLTLLMCRQEHFAEAEALQYHCIETMRMECGDDSPVTLKGIAVLAWIAARHDLLRGYPDGLLDEVTGQLAFLVATMMIIVVGPQHQDTRFAIKIWDKILLLHRNFMVLDEVEERLRAAVPGELGDEELFPHDMRYTQLWSLCTQCLRKDQECPPRDEAEMVERKPKTADHVQARINMIFAIVRWLQYRTDEAMALVASCIDQVKVTLEWDARFTAALDDMFFELHRKLWSKADREQQEMSFRMRARQ